MKNYWIIFSILLALRLAFDLIYVYKKKTISTKVKLIITFIPMVLLAWYSIYIFEGWTFLWIWPLSMVIWWAITDGILGLARHGKLTFMNENSFPDKYILKYLQNGTLATVTKVLLIVFFSGFLWYTKEKKK